MRYMRYMGIEEAASDLCGITVSKTMAKAPPAQP